MSALSAILLIACLFGSSVAPPVTQNKGAEQGEETGGDGLENYMEYHRYLKQVVDALESDPDFRKKLEHAKEEDIRSGNIARELEFVSHNVRTRLDEIKRTELERLKELKRKVIEIQDGNVIEDDPIHHHLDQNNRHTFEIEDLKRLIAKTTEDLAEADRRRREEFKEYELRKEFEKQEKLNHTVGEEREKLEKEYVYIENKHKEHDKLHQPGHKQQLEEVWEQQDRMQQDFNPKTFFVMHDLDSNGLWDEVEVKALFIKELDKMYQAGAPEDDMRERAEEMERMRESVFAEVDTNRDGFIDYNEFIAQTQKNDFQQDHGWKGLDEQKPFTDEELQEYIKQHHAQQYPPYNGQVVPPGVVHPNQVPQGYNVGVQPGYHPQVQQPNSVHYDYNSGHPGHVPPSYHPNQVQAPQGVPSGYQQQNVPPAQHYSSNNNNPQVPQPVQPQLYPGQLPQVQINPQQLQKQVPPLGNPQFPESKQGDEHGLNTNEIHVNRNPQQFNPNSVQAPQQQLNQNHAQQQGQAQIQNQNVQQQQNSPPQQQQNVPPQLAQANIQHNQQYGQQNLNKV